jgi:hypothetical protein
MNEELEFQVVLLKIQNKLTDSDRKQLHFAFCEDIPRRLQENDSLDTALNELGILFDHLEISKNNYDYLAHALEAIELHDCDQRLRGKILKFI